METPKPDRPPRGTPFAELLRVLRHSRQRARGVTLFEVALLSACAAAVALAVLLFVRPHVEAEHTDTALRDAARIRNAVVDWRQENGAGCPTLTQLAHESAELRTLNTDDPWGERFRVRCTETDVTVVSPGQDRVPNTSDDIRVPEGSTAARAVQNSPRS